MSQQQQQQIQLDPNELPNVQQQQKKAFRAGLTKLATSLGINNVFNRTSLSSDAISQNSALSKQQQSSVASKATDTDQESESGASTSRPAAVPFCVQNLEDSKRSTLTSSLNNNNNNNNNRAAISAVGGAGGHHHHHHHHHQQHLYRYNFNDYKVEGWLTTHKAFRDYTYYLAMQECNNLSLIDDDALPTIDFSFPNDFKFPYEKSKKMNEAIAGANDIDDDDDDDENYRAITSSSSSDSLENDELTKQIKLKSMKRKQDERLRLEEVRFQEKLSRFHHFKFIDKVDYDDLNEYLKKTTASSSLSSSSKSYNETEINAFEIFETNKEYICYLNKFYQLDHFNFIGKFVNETIAAASTTDDTQTVTESQQSSSVDDLSDSTNDLISGGGNGGEKADEEEIFILSVRLESKSTFECILRTKYGNNLDFIELDNFNNDLSSINVSKILYRLNKSLIIKEVKPIIHPIATELLAEFDKELVKNKFTFGVIYQRPGQTDEKDIFNNNVNSVEFDEFLRFIGNYVELKDFKGYRGGLDTSNFTGEYSVYEEYEDNQIMFHVSTLLPHSPKDQQQLERKRHIGNDRVCIVFQDEYTPFTPQMIKSKLLHVFIVVQPIQQQPQQPDSAKFYQISVLSKDDVPDIEPFIRKPHLFKKNELLKRFLLTKLINAEYASLKAKAFRKYTMKSIDFKLRNLHAELKKLTNQFVCDDFTYFGNLEKQLANAMSFNSLSSSTTMTTINGNSGSGNQFHFSSRKSKQQQQATSEMSNDSAIGGSAASASSASAVSFELLFRNYDLQTQYYLIKRLEAIHRQQQQQQLSDMKSSKLNSNNNVKSSSSSSSKNSRLKENVSKYFNFSRNHKEESSSSVGGGGDHLSFKESDSQSFQLYNSDNHSFKSNSNKKTNEYQQNQQQHLYTPAIKNLLPLKQEFNKEFTRKKFDFEISDSSENVVDDDENFDHDENGDDYDEYDVDNSNLEITNTDNNNNNNLNNNLRSSNATKQRLTKQISLIETDRNNLRADTPSAAAAASVAETSTENTLRRKFFSNLTSKKNVISPVTATSISSMAEKVKVKKKSKLNPSSATLLMSGDINKQKIESEKSSHYSSLERDLNANSINNKREQQKSDEKIKSSRSGKSSSKQATAATIIDSDVDTTNKRSSLNISDFEKTKTVIAATAAAKSIWRPKLLKHNAL